MKVKTLEEAVQRYGTITPKTDKAPAKWSEEYKWMELVPMPDWFSARVVVIGTQPCKRIYMNKDMKAPFLAALENIKTRGLEHELKTFDGCFAIRNVRGSDKPSAHSYGLAVDLNAGENPLGGKVTFSQELLQCFRDAGFTCGADFKSRVDGQHMSFCWE